MQTGTRCMPGSIGGRPYPPGGGQKSRQSIFLFGAFPLRAQSQIERKKVTMSRRPLPRELKAARGTLRAHRDNGGAPRIEGIPTKPARFAGHASAFWDEMVQVLTERGQICLDTAVSLEALCESYQECQELQECIRKEGRFYTVTRKDGARMERAHPALAMLADADRRFRAWLTEFGLTPASRSRVGVASPASSDAALSAYGL